MLYHRLKKHHCKEVTGVSEAFQGLFPKIPRATLKAIKTDFQGDARLTFFDAILMLKNVRI